MDSNGLGVISLTNAFIRHLRAEEAARRVAPLQLAGRIEDYLVKEFMQFVFWQSNGSRFCECNLGLKGEQKVDVALLRHKPGAGEQVEALIEAKYLRNRGHRSSNGNNKIDEIRTTLADLQRQLRLDPQIRHGYWPVKLLARTVKVYGLVFVSFTARGTDTPDHKDNFFKQVLTVAEGLQLQYHDLLKPYLRSAYEDRPITVFGEEWEVTLRAGLWRIKKEVEGTYYRRIVEQC